MLNSHRIPINTLRFYLLKYLIICELMPCTQFRNDTYKYTHLYLNTHINTEIHVCTLPHLSISLQHLYDVFFWVYMITVYEDNHFNKQLGLNNNRFKGKQRERGFESKPSLCK